MKGEHRLETGKKFQVFSIRESSGQGEKATWIRAGNAHVNRDGSVNVYLDVLPLDGKLHLREPKQDGEAGNAREVES